MANVIGQRVLRREDPRFLQGEGRYVENLRPADARHVVFVRSPFAHARVQGIDASAARALDGVEVYTAADVELPPYGPPPVPGLEQRMARFVMASDTVRHVGEIVAAVVAGSRAAAVDAAQLVLVDYEPLPAVVDMRKAAESGPFLFPEVGTNVCMAHAVEPDATLFDGCDVVVSGSLVSQRMAASPLEPRSSLAVRGDDGRLTAWLSTQTPHQDRDRLARLLGLDPGSIRVVGPDVGGGFGAKQLGVEDVLVAWLALETGDPIAWTETRSESMVALQHGRAQTLDFTIGGSRDGTVLAYRLAVLQDCGAYPALGALLPGLTSLMSSGVYAIPKIEVSTTAVVTNTTPIGAFRGAGRPEAAQAIERAMDTFAAELGLDAVDVRRKNLIAADAFPFTTASGARYDSGNYQGALDLALDAAGYAELRAEQRRRREAKEARQLGIGVSVYVEITNGLHEEEFGSVEITRDGEAIVRTGSFSHGQGHETTFAMLVAEQLGLPLEAIHLVKGDTDDVEHGTGTYGSKSTQLGGVVVEQAATGVLEAARKLAADLLEVSPEDLVVDAAGSRLQVAGAPSVGVSWPELAGRAERDGRLGELKADRKFRPDYPTFPFGSHVAVVEVDTETGAVELLRLIAVDDAGPLVNPLIAEGQVHGGVATGVAQALYEEFVYDEDGMPLSASFLGYRFPAASELPSFELVEQVTRSPVNALGVKGIGESGTIGATPAVQSAVVDALAHLGVRHVEMPANGERVWRAIAAAAG